jgi:hypothetical protein
LPLALGAADSGFLWQSVESGVGAEAAFVVAPAAPFAGSGAAEAVVDCAAVAEAGAGAAVEAVAAAAAAAETAACVVIAVAVVAVAVAAVADADAGADVLESVAGSGGSVSARNVRTSSGYWFSYSKMSLATITSNRPCLTHQPIIPRTHSHHQRLICSSTSTFTLRKQRSC